LPSKYVYNKICKAESETEDALQSDFSEDIYVIAKKIWAIKK